MTLNKKRYVSTYQIKSIPTMEDYIHDLLGPVQFEIVVESLKILQGYGLNNVYPMIEQQLSDDTNLDSSGHKNAVYGILKENLNEILLRHGIRAAEDAPLALLNTLSKALIEIVEDYDPNYILGEIDLTVTDEFPPENIFAKLIEFVYDVDELIILDTVEWFDATIITKLNHLLNEKIIPDVVTVNEERKALYLSFLSGLRKGAVFALLQSGLKIGQFDVLALMPYLEDTFAELDDADLAFELASVLLISNSPITLEAITTLVGLVRETDSDIMSLRVKVTKLLDGYIHD